MHCLKSNADCGIRCEDYEMTHDKSNVLNQLIKFHIKKIKTNRSPFNGEDRKLTVTSLTGNITQKYCLDGNNANHYMHHQGRKLLTYPIIRI